MPSRKEDKQSSQVPSPACSPSWIDDPCLAFKERTGLDPRIPELRAVAGAVANEIAHEAMQPIWRLLRKNKKLAERLASLRRDLSEIVDSPEIKDAQDLCDRHRDNIQSFLMLADPTQSSLHTEVNTRVALLNSLPRIEKMIENLEGLLNREDVENTRGAPPNWPGIVMVRRGDEAAGRLGRPLFDARSYALLAACFGFDPEAAADIDEGEHRWQETVATARGNRESRVSQDLRK